MPFLTELNDIWVLRDRKMVAEGDAKTINEMLQTKLVELKTGNWAILYRHKDTEELWDLVYPQGEMQGGGPRRLRRLDHGDPEKWDPYHNLVEGPTAPRPSTAAAPRLKDRRPGG